MKRFSVKRDIYKGRVVHLRLEEHTLPGGHKGIFEVLHHRHAGAVLPFLDAKTLLLIRQYRPAVGRYFLEIPAGLIDPGESPLQCARRELEEETGYKAKNVKKLISYYTSIGCMNEKITIYKATQLHPGLKAHEATEVIETIPTPLSQVKQLIQRGKIQDSKTLIALQTILY
ncbi:MAG: hypothetical protein A3I75_04770 [Deltaproteobacteria bacterium RIFCSPLOWO2_02_FULL_50_16]|nr:MAG: hypothetical protein A2053_00315 [Deltaproteobacteria bacterium GWA2_50_8]OGQ26777.1 MAG: hypothetical protein A3B79_04180 [Deltaproteobacteria bacterium RIFCSPHIGHO2_02_FULL_50_15]OGQ57058.1 MAG: hypothetical protein A3I75_04770 [Deltaproteobacteria bacterium RIFCSPLOWO2_02_FULL_50_16]